MNPMINYGNTQQNSSGGIPEGMVGYQQALLYVSHTIIILNCERNFKLENTTQLLRFDLH